MWMNCSENYCGLTSGNEQCDHLWRFVISSFLKNSRRLSFNHSFPQTNQDVNEDNTDFTNRSRLQCFFEIVRHARKCRQWLCVKNERMDMTCRGKQVERNFLLVYEVWDFRWEISTARQCATSGWYPQEDFSSQTLCGMTRVDSYFIFYFFLGKEPSRKFANRGAR